MIRNKSFDNSKPLLYLIATPIGNLKEMTPRALEVISECDIVAAEDTRNASSLLSHYGIKKTTFSLREHNEREASAQLIKKILSGTKVVYMSDAGYPCISDPGNIFVQECIKSGVAVSTVCGSSAFLNALCSSGMDTTHFYFYGFLSSKPSEAKKELDTLKDMKDSFILYESPHRIKDTLNLLQEILGDRNIVIGRELTKLNEEFTYMNVNEIDSVDIDSLKGEMVIIVEGNKIETSTDDQQIINYLNALLSKGLSKRDAIELTSTLLKENKNKVYDIAKNI